MVETDPAIGGADFISDTCGKPQRVFQRIGAGGRKAIFHPRILPSGHRTAAPTLRQDPGSYNAGIFPATTTMSESLSLPLFPLHSVLFPQGILNLRVFEARYMDMIGQCMRQETNFGICLIAEGEEVGKPALAHAVGTEARIVDWDMSEPGILGLSVRGGRRFRLTEQNAAADGLLNGSIEWLDDTRPAPVADRHAALLPLLGMIIRDAGERVIPPPHTLEDATWVGYRYAEILPIQTLAKQRLLELEDSDLRLDIIQEYLHQQGLVSKT